MASYFLQADSPKQTRLDPESRCVDVQAWGTPLDLATELGQTEMVRLLVSSGAETIMPSVLDMAKLKGYTEIVELLGSTKLSVAEYEASAVSSVRNIAKSQITYSVAVGKGNYAVDLEALESAGLIDSVLGSGAKDGYAFSTSGDSNTFIVSAIPLDYGSTGTSSFFSDESGVILYTRENRPATVEDWPLGQ